MRLRPARYVFPAIVAAGPFAGVALADTIYSNLQGNYLAQQTGSVTISKGTYGPAGYSENYDYGARSFGDDYTVAASAPTTVRNGFDAVEVQTLSYYGTLTPAAGTPAGSLGAAVNLYFYAKLPDGSPSANVYTVISFGYEAQGGPGLHSVTLNTPGFIPASGYFAMDFNLIRANNVTTGETTPLSYGEVAMTGHFGATPTVGSNDPTKYFGRNTSGQGSVTPALANSPANLQFQFDGPTGPAPSALYFTGALSSGLNTIANYSTTAAGTTPATALPGGGTDVYFAATNATTSNLGTLLGMNLSANSMTFGAGGAGANPVSITGISQLTINAANVAYAAGTGIVKQAGSGAVTIGARLILGASQTWTNGATTPLTATSSINLSGTTLTLAGTGDFALNGSVFSGGSLTLTTTGTTTLGGFNNYTGATTVTAGTLRAKSGAYNNFLANAGGIDVKAGAVVLDYTDAATPAATVRSLLAASFNAASTPGVMDSGQFRSTTATATKGIGYRDDGAGLVTVKAALYGDADLDGTVTISDFNSLAINFGIQTGGVWGIGDFDYNATVDISDFNLLAINFGQTIPLADRESELAPLITFAIAHDNLETFAALTGVPEPTSLGLLAVGAVGGLRRRRLPMAVRSQRVI